MKNLKIGHYALIALIIIVLALTQVLINKNRQLNVSNRLVGALDSQNKELIDKHYYLNEIERVQGYYRYKAGYTVNSVEQLRDAKQEIDGLKKKLYEEQNIEITQDYYTNEKEGYKVYIEEGNGSLIVTVKYFETGTNLTGYSIPE